MIEGRTDADIVAQLRAAVDAGVLPPRAQKAGDRLLARLTLPVRVAILGHPGSGKSELLNLIAGQRVVPSGFRHPTLELRHAETARTTLCVEDGTKTVREGIDLPSRPEPGLQMIRIEAPIPILKRISLIEVVSQGGAEEERFGVVWASERADVVLWCSQEFTLAEEWLWSAMPDRLKDHGFLVLTKADELIRRKKFEKKLEDLKSIVAEEFHSLIPVATLHALDAISDNGEVDEQAMVSSGGRALISAILNHVDLGHRADIDAALLLLSRYAEAVRDVSAATATIHSAASEFHSAAARTAVAPKHPEVASDKSNAPKPAAANTAVEVDCERVSLALEYLKSRAANLDRAVASGDDAPSFVLDHCAETANELAEMLADAGPGGGSFALLQEDVLEASEKLVLMQLERGDGPAADAVTLLLQVRRSIAQSLAA